ncbi:MAG: molybdopterin molybdotransferase MoeA, partial [Gemmatimonadota bacterium]
MTRFESREADWLPVDQAVRRVVSTATPLPAERVPLDEALGRALSEELSARATLPPFDNSAMDGYAVRGEDVKGASEEAPRTLRVVGETRAGEPPAAKVGTGEAIRIMTGAPVPPGADTVVRVEHTDAEEGRGGRVVVRRDDDRGRHIRPAGQDMTRGEVVLREGTTVTPGVVAVAAALGLETLPTRRRPRVAVLSSGEELRGPEDFADVVRGVGVPDTNGPALAAALRRVGADPVRLGVARDDVDDIRERVGRAGGCDALVTSG